MNNKMFASIIIIVVAFFLVVMLNDNVYEIQNKEFNVVELFEGRGYFDNVSLTYDSTVGVGDVRSIEFSNNGEYLAIGIFSANKLRLYEWDSVNTEYDALIPTVSVSGVGSVYSVEFDDTDSYLVLGHTTAPYIKLYDVIDNFNSISDPDLEVDNVVYDAKYYEDEYLIVGGDMTNYIQVFKYSGGNYSKLSNNIDVLPTGRVTDIEYSNGYIHVSTLISPYIISYKVVGDNLVKVASPTNLPNSSGNVIETSENGNIVVVGTTGSPYIKAYSFSNGVYTDVTFDIIPTQTLDTLSLHFIDNSYLYVGGDNDIYKYKLMGDEFILQVNDITTFDTPVNVLDCNTVLGRFVVGDAVDYELYIGSSEITFDNLELTNTPDVINSVKQLGIEKEYLIIGTTMSIIDEVYNQTITVDYSYTIREEDRLIEMLPIIALVGLVLAIGGIAMSGGKKL